MNQTEIDTVLQWVNEQLHAGYPLTAEEINRAFTALQARVDEQHSQLIGASVVADRLADQRDEARTQLAAAQAEVARLKQAVEKPDGLDRYWLLAEELATLRAAIAEAVTALREIEWSNDSKWQQDRAKHALLKLRNLDQPEGEDALVEALSHCDGIGTFNRCGDREVVLTFADHESGMKAFEALEALASRGLVVRGEGVER